jgi:hypothetical protein
LSKFTHLYVFVNCFWTFLGAYFFQDLHLKNVDINDAGPNDVGPNDVGPNDVGPNDAGPNDAGPNVSSEDVRSHVSNGVKNVGWQKTSARNDNKNKEPGQGDRMSLSKKSPKASPNALYVKINDHRLFTAEKKYPKFWLPLY